MTRWDLKSGGNVSRWSNKRMWSLQNVWLSFCSSLASLLKRAVSERSRRASKPSRCEREHLLDMDPCYKSCERMEERYHSLHSSLPIPSTIPGNCHVRRHHVFVSFFFFFLESLFHFISTRLFHCFHDYQLLVLMA